MAIGSPRTTAHLRTPRAAAIAGLLFSVLLLVAFLLLRMAVPAFPAAISYEANVLQRRSDDGLCCD